MMLPRRRLAALLGLDTNPRPLDDKVPEGQGNHDPDGVNTRRRVKRCAELSLFRIEGPRMIRGGQLAPARGGRLPGCRGDRLRGRSIRIYPGPAVYPWVLIRSQIELDQLADAGLIPWTRLSTPREQMTPGQVLEVEQLAQHALSQRGPPPST